MRSSAPEAINLPELEKRAHITLPVWAVPVKSNRLASELASLSRSSTASVDQTRILVSRPEVTSFEPSGLVKTEEIDARLFRSVDLSSASNRENRKDDNKPNKGKDYGSGQIAEAHLRA